MQRVLVLLLAMAAPALAVEGPVTRGAVCVENASIVELGDALAAGTTTAGAAAT